MCTNEQEKIYSECPTQAELQNLITEMGSDDPRSIYYDRKCVRPKISFWSTFANITLPLLVAVGVFLLTKDSAHIVVRLLPFILLFVYMLIRIKSELLFLIKLYQRFAPESIRNRCRFEPSCSEYMQLSINKYGVIKGVKKGINRLWRCSAKHNDGGYDNP